jgi:AcrR family transcriptional regulator
MTDRRQQLAEAATDYALTHGLIGLSLRPLAAEIGTSDRMLLYHFTDKDDLVATVLRTSNERSVAGLRAMPASVDPGRAVVELWAVNSAPAMARCARMYVEASALGVLGREPYATVVGEANEVWLAALADHLAASGVPRAWAARAAALVDATFMGLHLDLQLDDGDALRRTVTDLARAVGDRWGPPRVSA